MWNLFRSLIDRAKVLLAVRAVQELEEEALAAAAGRVASLRRLADGCQAEGLPEVARELRQKADELEHAGSLPAAPLTTPSPSLPPAAVGGRGKRTG